MSQYNIKKKIRPKKILEIGSNDGSFLRNFNKEPNLHIVFKSAERLKNFEKKLIKTSSISGFLPNKIDITKIKSFIIKKIVF